MNKKLMSLIMVGMLCVCMSGCSSEEAPEEKPKEETKVEEPVKKEEVKEDAQDKENTTKIETINRDDEEFNKYISTAMSDEEYVSYFDKLYLYRGDFDATIMDIQLEEGKSTIYEILVACESGPYVKLNNLQLVGSEAVLHPGDEVNVSGLIDGYDIDHGYLKLKNGNVVSK